MATKKPSKILETPISIEGSSLNPPVPRRRGAPSKYNPEFSDIIFEVAERGGHKAEMCKLMGINEDTFTEWCKTYPRFGKAWHDSKTISKAFYEDLLLKAATGQIEKVNFNSIAMIMNNKFGDEYKRSHNGGAQGTHIEITNNNLNVKDSRSIDEQIAQKLANLNSLGLQLGSAPLLIEHDEEEDEEDNEI